MCVQSFSCLSVALRRRITQIPRTLVQDSCAVGLVSLHRLTSMIDHRDIVKQAHVSCIDHTMQDRPFSVADPGRGMQGRVPADPKKCGRACDK